MFPPRLLLPLILAGAARADGPDHWAFRRLDRPSWPAGRESARTRTPVDAFVLARLEAHGLTFAPDAGRHALIRRATFDLLGLPPAPEEVTSFVHDPRPDAYERLLDRLLASPHFGERWGRHWLDNAGHTDVTGGDNDAGIIKLGENRWRYRDYVVRCFNEDRPFDRFLTEQLAGDELADWRGRTTFDDRARELLVATGFLRVAADDTDENELNTPDIRHGVLQRTVEGLASNLLGLTLNCAKCHDHKYEPLPQRDYYRLIALVQPALDPARWLQPKARQVKDAAWGHLQAVYDAGPPTPTYLLKRGNHQTPGPEVAPGFPEVLGATFAPEPVRGESSGRRLALARWLNDADTPAGALVLRVRVNRVWTHLFGKGLVETGDNFGRTGAAPSHPELLEWLASEFAAEGRHLKPLLKRLMTSTAYRQASAAGPPPAADPENRLLGRQRLRRLEAEAVRDSLLSVGGNLDRALGGPPVPVEARPDGTVAVKEKDQPSAAKYRRGLYLLARRNYHPTLLGVFDQPNLTAPCTCRAPSAVVLQSLTMLNDSFVLEQAEWLAARVAREGAGCRVEAAFRVALGRPPTPREAAWCAEALRRHGDDARALARLCHVLLNTSEFLYVP